MDQQVAAYPHNAREGLTGAESDLAAITALLADGVHPSKDQWPHAFVPLRFVGRLINCRQRSPTALRNVVIGARRQPTAEAVMVGW